MSSLLYERLRQRDALATLLRPGSTTNRFSTRRYANLSTKDDANNYPKTVLVNQ
ncbi:hypothetical protein [Nostoc sp. CCY 9925]|uniref:hypothetical protein n=1 Tax=Nostoc sp. CCY 9925 TaxID=3103865 RepID=UPI0039C685C9